ncbi:hypothetical protein A1QO_02645 [Vibrio genomosp. F10 str. ZF-129]|uniref:Uncharacterized protein n=1 Tax=Vibrio genomosp. F10 str. ZF-129 TaxID=1187848 RepID=A0A1E5BKD5_9VIBR|nr:hypothetical protein [Vibrio genomosp. F10]OEE38296.1 hypothetical protein A1QO_02645 [Vibrio genomosp. F10 str. ZF-129]
MRDKWVFKVVLIIVALCKITLGSGTHKEVSSFKLLTVAIVMNGMGLFIDSETPWAVLFVELNPTDWLNALMGGMVMFVFSLALVVIIGRKLDDIFTIFSNKS